MLSLHMPDIKYALTSTEREKKNVFDDVIITLLLASPLRLELCV